MGLIVLLFSQITTLLLLLQFFSFFSSSSFYYLWRARGGPAVVHPELGLDEEHVGVPGPRKSLKAYV
jgi:hypothetical protein